MHVSVYIIYKFLENVGSIEQSIWHNQIFKQYRTMGKVSGFEQIDLARLIQREENKIKPK